MKKIGIMGGSFDPIHYGHLLLAEQAFDSEALDQVLFIPASVSPFKVGTPPTEKHHRHEMVRLATEDHSGFLVSDLELKREGASYTIDTLCEVQKRYGEDARLYFICGTDSFLSMEKWYCAEQIFSNHTIIVGARPRYKDVSRDAMVAKLELLYNATIRRVEMPKVDLSSTEIKRRIKEEKSIRYMMPAKVEEYIQKHRLYRESV